MAQVDIFTKDQFEAALPSDKATGKRLWEYVGLIQGEHTYRVKPFALPYAIEVRSSVKGNGTSAGTGEDSIRCWITTDTGAPFGGKIGRWTTRLPGWQERLTVALRTLAGMIKSIKACPSCGSPCPVWKAGNKAKPENKGRLFRNCPNKCNGAFQWLDRDSEEVESGKVQAESGQGNLGALVNKRLAVKEPLSWQPASKQVIDRLTAIVKKAIARLDDCEAEECNALANELRADLQGTLRP